MTMINKLIAKIKETGAPIVVGLDPMMKYIPEQLLQNMGKHWKAPQKQYSGIIKRS